MQGNPIYQYCTLRPGYVAQRRWQCFCNGCIELLRVGPSALGASSLAVPGCVRASEAAYQSSKRTKNQLGSTAASQRSSKRRKDGSSLASKIKGPGTFCLFQNRAGHGDEELWLGRTTSVSPHLPQGQCTKQIPRRTTETIAEIRFDSGDYMIGVQWYAKGERGLYRRWDAEAPSLQNSTELVAIDVSPELASGDALPRCAPRTGTAAEAAEIAKEKGRRYRIPAAVWATALGRVV
jgi:hypothetical protein